MYSVIAQHSSENLLGDISLSPSEPSLRKREKAYCLLVKKRIKSGSHVQYIPDSKEVK
jgi:hypothetical protein